MGAETEAKTVIAPASESLVPVPPSVSKKTLATWKKQLKNLKTKDAGKKIDGLRYCAQDEQFVREQSDVLPLLMELLARVKTPDVVAETLRTLHTLLTQSETVGVRATSAADASVADSTAPLPVVQLHPEQNRQFIIDASKGDTPSSWKAGEPFVALFRANVSPEIKLQAIEVFTVLLQHCTQLAINSDDTVPLVAFQTSGTPATALLACLAVNHTVLQLAALDCIGLLFQHPPSVEFLTVFHASDGLTTIQRFAERPERRFHAALLTIAESFSHHELGRGYLRATGMADTVRVLLTAALETTTTTIATATATPSVPIALTIDEAALMHDNVAVAARIYVRMLFATELTSHHRTRTTLTDEYASVPVVVETLIAILQRDINGVVSPPPPPAAPAGTNAAAQAAAAAAAATATTLAALFPFSAAKSVDMVTSLGRMVEASDLVQRHAKQHGLLAILLQAFRVPSESALHQSADKLLHLCTWLPRERAVLGDDVDSAVGSVDPCLFSPEPAAATAADNLDSGPPVEPSALLSLDTFLPILEATATSPSTTDDLSTQSPSDTVVFRLVRWLAVVVDAPLNAQALGDATMNVLVKLMLETKSSQTMLGGFVAKCIHAIALQNADACELCSAETRNPVGALVAFLHTAYPSVEPAPTQRAVSVASEIDTLASSDPAMPYAVELSLEAAAAFRVEWITECDEQETFVPHSLTQACHAIDPFFCAAKALEVMASAYERRSQTNGASVDFAELLTQRLETAGKNAMVAANTKKKSSMDVVTAKSSASTGEAPVLCVLERVADVFQLLGRFSSKNGEVAVSLLTTLRALMALPGGVRAMLTLAKSAIDAVSVDVPSEGTSGEPAEAVTPVVHPPNPSAWPWTKDEAQRTEYGWLLAPILSVFETPVTCFFQLEAAVAVLAAIVHDASESMPSPPPATTGVIASVEVAISDTDRFLNAALSQGALVYLLAILDSERVPRCPRDRSRREELAQSVVSLACRMIERGTQKQMHALAKRQELLDLHEQLTAAAAAAAATATAGSKHAKADTGPTIDVASLQSQKLEYQATWARELLDATFDVPRFDYRRVSALLLAVQLGQDEIAQALLAAGAAADGTTALDATTPLMLALLTKNTPLARALLEAGANVNAITQDGRDVCVWACALTAPVRDDLTALITRIHSSKVATQFVLPLDALIELDSEDGTPDVALFEVLLRHSLDVNVSDADGNFVLHALLSQCVVRKRMRGLDMCFRYHSTRHVDPAVLLALATRVVEHHGADINACNRLGQTPLHVALLHGHTDAALSLLARGANPNVRDAFGLLPLHCACVGFFESSEQAIQVVDALLAAATKHELVDGVHVDRRKYKTAREKEAVEVEALLDRGFADVRAPPALARTLATVEQVLSTASLPSDGFLPWHFACGAGSHLNSSSLCLADEMHARLVTNGEVRAAILTHLVQKYNVSLDARTAKQLTGLQLAAKTDVNGSNTAVLDVLLASAALPAILNAVHEPTSIDALLPIEEGALVELTTDALLYVPHAHVSSRSFQHKYHVSLPDGNHLEGLDRHQLKRTASGASSWSSSSSLRYTLRMESAFSALHYAVQVSDDLSRRLLDVPGIALQPDGSDLPLLALACAARRSPDVVARLVTPQVNVRVHLPLHDGTSHEQSGDSGSGSGTAGSNPSGRAASRKQAAALHFAVVYEDVELVRTLVARKDHTNVNVRRSGDGFTPLHLACGMGDLAIIKLLLDYGANLIQMSTVSSLSSGVTPFHLLIKSDGMENEKLKELIADGYITREMLLEGLGAPAVVATKAGSKQDESRDAALVLGGGTEHSDDRDDEMEISCVLLDEEEHNLSLFTHVEQLVATKRSATGYALRLQSELAKSDDVLSLFFQLISGTSKAATASSTSSGRNSSLSHVTEEDAGASDTPRTEAVSSSDDDTSLLDARHQFAQLKHWHECYAQQLVRSQWVDASKASVAKTLRRSSFDRRSTRELLALTVASEEKPLA